MVVSTDQLIPRAYSGALTFTTAVLRTIIPTSRTQRDVNPLNLSYRARLSRTLGSTQARPWLVVVDIPSFLVRSVAALSNTRGSMKLFTTAQPLYSLVCPVEKNKKLLKISRNSSCRRRPRRSVADRSHQKEQEQTSQWVCGVSLVCSASRRAVQAAGCRTPVIIVVELEVSGVSCYVSSVLYIRVVWVPPRIVTHTKSTIGPAHLFLSAYERCRACLGRRCPRRLVLCFFRLPGPEVMAGPGVERRHCQRFTRTARI